MLTKIPHSNTNFDRNICLKAYTHKSLQNYSCKAQNGQYDNMNINFQQLLATNSPGARTEELHRKKKECEGFNY